MTVCATCGSENPDEFRFCGSCGAALAEGSLPAREVRKTVTVVFCDLTGSTSLGEQLDPEAVRATMRRYYDEARAILEHHGGTVEKFIGDAVMAVFGVPQAHEDDALRAVRASAELRDAVTTLGLQARVGVNTGEVVAGEGDALVTGDAVNVAARLEQVAEPGEILLGEETRRLVRDAVEVEAFEVELRGKRAAVQAYRLRKLDLEAPGLTRRLDSPLVGRLRELQRLRDDFEHTVAQRSSYLFTLLGAAGVGKSRLVAEFTQDVGPRARVLRGRCLHYGEGITYWPLVEVLLQLETDPQAVLALPSPTDAAVATRKLLEERANEHPLVVLVDDIQWAEPVFLDLVEHIADWSRGAPIFLLCIARPELLELRPAWGGGKPNATSLMLEPLAENEASTLIDNLLGASRLADPVRERILRASEGNPLFVEEMLLMLREDAGVGEVEVPPTIHALLQARIDRLSTEERSVIERGAVEGEVFHRSPVAELAPPRVRTALDDHLQRLIRNELIRPERATLPGDDAFRFRHLLIRDAAYESLPKETRADLHERFALWIDEHVELVEQDEIVGYHLEQAVLYRRELGRNDGGVASLAAKRLATAGFAALGRGDVRAGAGLLERAAALLAPGDDERLRLLPELVMARLDGGRFEDARAHVHELEETPGERAQGYAAVLRVAYGAYAGEGSFHEGRPELAAARATFERLGDDAGLARALEMEANAEWASCRAEATATVCREAIPIALRAQNHRLANDMRGLVLLAHSFGPTPVGDAEREIAAVLDESRGVVRIEAVGQMALGRLAAMRGDFSAARESFRQGRQALREAGLRVWAAGGSQGESEIEMLAGQLETALRLVREGFDELDEFGEHALASTNAAYVAALLERLGRTDEAAQWVARARELSPAGDITTLATADYVEALLAVRTSDHQRAIELARWAVAQAEPTDFWALRGSTYEALGKVAAATGRAEEARAAHRDALAVYEAKGVTVAAERVRELITEL